MTYREAAIDDVSHRCVAKGPTGRSKIVQIHPSRLCNLRCRHCYSLSGPTERDALDGSLLKHAIDDAAELGYGVVSFSGGEPLLYGDLREVLTHAGDRGLFRTLTSNGTLFDEGRLGAIDGVLELLAISVDGIPASHDAMRGEGMFARMEGNLERVRRSGIPFGFIFTLTQTNVGELPWVAQYALDQGASLLQVHPLEEQGRAATEMIDATPDAILGAVAHLQSLQLEERSGGRLVVQVDLVNRPTLLKRPELVYADEGSSADAPLSDLVSPLIIEADGRVVPLQHGLHDSYALGNLHDSSLVELADHWSLTTFSRYRDLCRAVYDAATADDGPPYLNWFDAISRASRSPEFRARTTTSKAIA